MTSTCLRSALVIVAVAGLGFAPGDARAQATAHFKIRRLSLRAGTQDGPEGLSHCNKSFDFDDVSGVEEGSEPSPDIACSAGSASSHVSVVTSAPHDSNVSALTTTADASVQRTDEPFEVANAVFFEQAMFTATPGTSFEDDGGFFSVVHCTPNGVATSETVGDGVFSATGTICLDSGLRPLPDSFLPGFPTNQHRVQTGTIRFGAPRGACCNPNFNPDPDEEDILCEERPPARCRSRFVYQGDGTTCGGTCALGDDFTWTDPAGGSFDDAANWQPPVVPTSGAGHDDTAIFDLANTYPVNVAGARAKRMIIRNSSIDLVGGTAEVTSSSLVEPSLVVGQNGKLHLVSGTLTSVHSVLGDVSGGLAEVDLISGTPIWNNTGRLTIGDAGPGRLTVVSGAVTSAESRIGGGTLGAGEAIVGGPGTWTTGNLGLGLGGGPGTLEIKDGGVVTSDGAVIGVIVSDGNRVDVRGATAGGDPSQWNVAGMLEVGSAGLGVLAIRNGGHVGTASLKIGELGDVTIQRDAAGADTATLDVSGTVTIAGGLDANNLPRGLVVGDGASLTAGEIVVEDGVLIGDGDILTGTWKIRKDGNALLSGGGVGVAQAAVTVDGQLSFFSDSVADLQGGLIIGSGADGPGVAGTVSFEKNGSEAVTGTIANGVFLGNGLLSITGGPTVTVGGTVDIGTSAVAGDSATVFVDDPNGNGPSTLTVTQGKINVGVLGPGQLSVSEGSSVTTPALALGGAPGATGAVFIEDATLTTTGDVAISDQAVATLNVTGGPHGTGLVVGGAIAIGTPLAGGAIFLSDSGRVSAANGITVNAGSFIAGNGTAAATVTVNPGGEVKAGVSIVPPAPVLAPKSARQRTQAERAPASRVRAAQSSTGLTVTGDLTMSSGSTLRIEIDGIEDGLPAFLVQGAATLAGTLEIAFVDGFVPRAGDELLLFEVLGLASGTFTNTVVTGLPLGWKGELSGTGAGLALTVFGDYLCYQTGAAKGAKFPKGLVGALTTPGGAIDFGVKKPALLCNPSGPSTGSQQTVDAQLRGYLVTNANADPLALAGRALRVTNGLHPNGEIVVDTKTTTIALAPAAKCVDAPPGTCPTDLAAPATGDAYVCAPAKVSKRGAAFPKGLTASAVDTFGEPRTYALGKPTRVCAPTSGALDHALACYKAKPLGKACDLAAPANAAAPCKSEPDCGGVKKVTSFCAKQGKHAKVGDLVLATSLARDRATTVKPLELCVPSTLSAP